MYRRFWLHLIIVGGLWSYSQSSWADYWIQIASYSKQNYADKTARSLAEAGFPVGMRTLNGADGNPLIQLLMGPYQDRQTAKNDLTQLQNLGLAQDGFIRVYKYALTVERPRISTKEEDETPSVSEPSPTLPAATPSAAISASPITQKTESGTVAQDKESKSGTDASIPLVMEDADLLLGIGQKRRSLHLLGFFQSELAYAESPTNHLTKFRNMLELGAEGRLSSAMAWKISGRVAYDAVFDLNNFYSTNVRDDQQLEESVRETYMDVSAGDWDFRLGRQQIIWGEMVGLFFADVVSAKDLHEFVLPEFDVLRIPQWAVRSEYFKGDFHGEVIWIPYPSYDDIGVPGSEFYPYPPPPPAGYGMIIRDERKPAGSLADSNYGLRLSDLINGWDLSAFYYNSMDTSPTFFREVVTTPAPAFIYSPDHKRIEQIGSTLSKGYEDAVLKLEMVYTRNRRYPINDISDADGVIEKDSLDYALGMDYNLPGNTLLNVQFYQRWFPDHDSAMVQKQAESGASFYLSSELFDGDIEPQLLVMKSLSRGDWMARPKVVWTLSGNLRWVVGADIFDGIHTGLFGQYDGNDRLYTEFRYIF